MNTVIQNEYSRIAEYWKSNPCDGGNKNFPFWMFKYKKVLEMGCGTGNDGCQFQEQGALYTGIDIAPHKPYILKMNAESLDFPDNYFDLVYSWGVIHHTVNPQQVAQEIYRVLNCNGRFYVMLYNKPSIRYNLDIMFLRRIAWILRYYRYREIRQRMPRPDKSEWISINTDNLGCPLSRVYSKQEAHNLFKWFNEVSSYTTNWGWFRILTGVKN